MTGADAAMRVLVLDDNPDDRALVEREVKALFPGATLLEPTDAAALEAALAGATPDLVVTDLDLRWANGRDVLAAAKARFPGCPVVMFTGTGDETTAVELMKAGLDDYVVKSPRQLPRLRASIRIAVEAARSRAALTDREARLARALAHEQTIVRELHHRVRNNLQIIAGLLLLRGKGADAATRARLEEVAGRVRTLAAVQSRIYETEALDSVDFRAALSDIAHMLSGLFGSGHVDLRCDFDGPLVLEVSRAMPLGLLCCEAILNALKHAWPAGGAEAPGAGRRGTLAVELRTQGVSRPEIRIRDDGIGFARDPLTTGLGTRLMRALAREARTEVETRATPGEGTAITVRLT